MQYAHKDLAKEIMNNLDKTPAIETIEPVETTDGTVTIESTDITDNFPVQSPPTTAWYKDMGLNMAIVAMVLFLVTVGIMVANSITQETTHISTECGVDNIRLKGKIPAVYDGDVKAFQKDNPELASKWLHETTGGCGQIAR